MSESIAIQELTLRGDVGSERRSTMDILRSGEVVDIKDKVPGGIVPSNKPKLVTFENVYGDRREAVVKQLSKESQDIRKIWGVEQQTRMELAGAWIAQAMEYEEFPATCIRKLDLDNTSNPEECVVVEFMTEAGSYYKLSMKNRIEGVGDMNAFDIVTWSLDRKSPNVIVEDDGGKYVARPIDHGIILLNSDSLRLIESGSKPEFGQVSDRVRHGLREMVDNRAKAEALRKRLSGLLPQVQIDDMFSRIKMVSDELERTGNISSLLEHYQQKMIGYRKPQVDVWAGAFYKGSLSL